MLTEPSAAGWRRHLPYLLALVAIGVAVNLNFSRMGFMPLDHSIVFDGGWRILNGQVPWRDFVTPAGVVPAAMQAVFFAVLGTNWFAFCLHSSVVNGLFAAMLYVLLAILYLPRPLAFFYALCAIFFFYPPIGVPYMEQHSFFFTLAAITCAVAGNYSDSTRAQKVLWGLVPPLALLAFFSKQVPFAFAAISLPALLVVPATSRISVRVRSCAVGAAASVALLFLLGATTGVSASDFIDYTFVRPGRMNSARIGSWTALAEVAIRDRIAQPLRMGIRSVRGAAAVYLAAVLALPFLVLLQAKARGRRSHTPEAMSRLFCALLLAPITYASSLLLQVVTNNQGQNALAFYPVSAGLLHAALCSAIRDAAAGTAVLLAHRRPLLTVASGVAIVGVSIVPIYGWTIDTMVFARNVDGTRMVNDMIFDAKLAADSASQLPAGMEFVRWTPPRGCRLEGWAQLVAFLRSHQGNVLIIGDNLVTYGLAAKPSIGPNLWFHPGLSMPAPGEPAFIRYQDELISRVAHEDVRYIVVEGTGTWAGLTLAQFSRVDTWLRSGWCRTRSFGQDIVFEKCNPSPRAAPGS